MVRAPGDVGEGAHQALVVVEGGHLEVGHGNARADERVAQIGLAGIAAAAAGAARHDDEVGVKRHDGLQVHCREVPHRGHIRTLDAARTGRLERIIGDAHERAPSQLPGVRETAHAGHHALGVVHGDLVARIVGEGDRAGRRCFRCGSLGSGGLGRLLLLGRTARRNLTPLLPATDQRQSKRRGGSAQYKLLQNKILSIQKLTGSPKEVSEVATGA